MTGRTLEEIEALATEATPGPWVLNSDPPYDSVVGSNGRTVCCDTAYYPTAVDIEDMRLIAALPDLLAIAQGQRERLAALDNAPRWSRHSERCGVAAALGVTTDRVDLDSVVYAVVKKLMDMRGGAAILSIELQEWMGKWPHQAASRR